VYRYKIHKELKLIFIQLLGDLTLTEVIELNLQLFADPDFSTTFNGLCDARHAKLKLNLKNLHQIHRAISELGGTQGYWAHLIENNPRNATLTLEYAAACPRPHHGKVFYTLEEAERFLGYQDLKTYLI